MSSVSHLASNSSDPHVLHQAGQLLTLLLAVLPCQLMDSDDGSEEDLDCDSRCLVTIRRHMKTVNKLGIQVVQEILNLSEGRLVGDDSDVG